MNIALINNVYPPIISGSSFYTMSLAQELAKKKHHVVVITAQSSNSNQLEEIDGVKIYRLPVYKLPQSSLWMNFPDFTFSLTPANIKRMLNILRNEKIEIMHQCNNIFDLVFASAYCSKKLHIPLVGSLTTQIQHPGKLINNILSLFDRHFLKHTYVKFVKHFIALDLETKRYIKTRYNRIQNVTLVPFTISPFMKELTLKHRKTDYSHVHFRGLSWGHISSLKDRLELIRAWSILVQKYPQAELVIIGNVLMPQIQEEIDKLGLNKNIRMTGKLPIEEIMDLIAVSDFGCMFLSEHLPFNKGVGTTNLETMACGLPTIIDAGDAFFGTEYEFVGGKEFILPQTRQPEELAAIICELFENEELRSRVGNAGRYFVQDLLTWDHIITDLEEVYHNQLGSKQ
jgi:glycosyltransferase involved in cell wall biosynthesis